jgi:Uma2 family endonuclease
MSIVEYPVPPPPAILVHGVDWETYRALREDPENLHLRMTFDKGRLEFMSPSKLHERVAILLAQMVFAWTDEKNIDRQGCGTVTFQREDLAHGLEPDQCFYIANEPLVRGRDELDLTRDPPPDLVIEVDITSPSRRRLPLYQALGVPEVWVWRADMLTVYVLSKSGVYEEHNESDMLPGFPLSNAAELLDLRTAMSETELMRRFRDAIRALSRVKEDRGRPRLS